MIENRDAYIQRELEVYRAILWAYEHRDEIFAADPALALWLVEDGAEVSEEAARAVFDLEFDLADLDEDYPRRLRRAIADDEAWLASPAGALHPAWLGRSRPSSPTSNAPAVPASGSSTSPSSPGLTRWRWRGTPMESGRGYGSMPSATLRTSSTRSPTRCMTRSSRPRAAAGPEARSLPMRTGLRALPVPIAATERQG